MKNEDQSYVALPFPRSRQLMVDGGQIGSSKHTVHGLVEFDITLPRALLQHHKEKTGESLSFTAFFLACLGQAVDLDRSMHAYRSWRNQLLIFDEVDVNTLFEVEIEGRPTIRPHILRGVNTQSVYDLHRTIRAFQQNHAHSAESTLIEWFVLLPGVVRRIALRLLFRNPQWVKALYGTVMVTSIGMFGEGGGWGIPFSNHTLQLTLGGITKKPGIVEDRIEVREYLSVTVSVDHDIVDGAPAARFTQRLRELVESGYGLQ